MNSMNLATIFLSTPGNPFGSALETGQTHQAMLPECPLQSGLRRPELFRLDPDKIVLLAKEKHLSA